jgi:glucose/mannose-6-phosphate isomerase
VIDLDRSPLFRDVDSKGMLDRILGMPGQIRDAWSIAQGLSFPAEYADAANVVICGMGGSAIGGDLVRTLADRESRAPLSVLRDYDLPAYVDSRSLVILSSFSGTTDETLSAGEQALKVGARVVAITTGGDLAERANTAGIPLAQYSFGGTPREAGGYSTLMILGVLCRLGYLADKTVEVDAASETLEQMIATIGPEVPAEMNPAKRLAQKLYGKLVLIYGGGLLAEVARRWKGQLNENAKHWAFFEQLPELNHNAVLGYQFPTHVGQKAVVVMLSSTLSRQGLRARERITEELLARWGIPTETVQARGATPLEHILSTVYVGDFVSYYLAMVNDVDPSDMATITFLKARLARETKDG